MKKSTLHIMAATLIAPEGANLWRGVWRSEVQPTIRGCVKIFLKGPDAPAYDTDACLNFEGCYKSGRCEHIRPHVAMTEGIGSAKADQNSRNFSLVLVGHTEDSLTARYETKIPHYDRGLLELTKTSEKTMEICPVEGALCVIV